MLVLVLMDLDYVGAGLLRSLHEIGLGPGVAIP